MTDCTRCAVGVTLGDYYDFFEDAPEEATDVVPGCILHGFASWADPLPEDDEWPALEIEWLRKAREHAAYRAEVLGE